MKIGKIENKGAVMTNKLTIRMREDGKCDFESKHPISFEDLLSVVMSLSLGYMRRMTENAPAEAHEHVKGELYDAFNKAASHTLEAFAPEYELRPGLTAQALLEMENDIVMRGDLDKIEVGS